MERKKILPMIVEMVGRSSAEQNILVGERWEPELALAGFDGPETMAPRSPSTFPNGSM